MTQTIHPSEEAMPVSFMQDVREQFRLSKNPETLFPDAIVETLTLGVNGIDTKFYCISPQGDVDSTNTLNTGLLTDFVMYPDLIQASLDRNERVLGMDFKHRVGGRRNVSRHHHDANIALYDYCKENTIKGEAYGKNGSGFVLHKMPDEETTGNKKQTLSGHSRGTAISPLLAKELADRGLISPDDTVLEPINPVISDLSKRDLPFLAGTLFRHVVVDVAPPLAREAFGNLRELKRAYGEDVTDEETARIRSPELLTKVRRAGALVRHLGGNLSSPTTIVKQSLDFLGGMSEDGVTYIGNVTESETDEDRLTYLGEYIKLAKKGYDIRMIVGAKDSLLPVSNETLEELINAGVTIAMTNDGHSEIMPDAKKYAKIFHFDEEKDYPTEEEVQEFKEKLEESKDITNRLGHKVANKLASFAVGRIREKFDLNV